MTDGMAAVWTTLTGAVPGVDTEPGPDAATTRYACWDCNLPDLHNGDGDGIGSCNCPRCETCNGAPSTCNCWSDQVRRISGDDDGGDWTGRLYELSVDTHPGVHPGTGIQSVKAVEDGRE